MESASGAAGVVAASWPKCSGTYIVREKALESHARAYDLYSEHAALVLLLQNPCVCERGAERHLSSRAGANPENYWYGGALRLYAEKPAQPLARSNLRGAL